MNPTSAPTSSPRSLRGFTLVELMISIAIVVVLMVGITKVFSLTSSTAGATNTVGAAIRDARAAQTTFYNDLGNAASDMPFMILRSSAQPAFRNKADQLGDRDYNSGVSISAQFHEMATVDLNGDNKEGDPTVAGETYNPTNVNNRIHRIDVFSFFARGLFPRQTGNQAYNNPFDPNGVYVSSLTSNEAWIWYGHLRLANNSSTPVYFDPGDTSAETATSKNDNNKYASDWTLGRFVNVMKSPVGGRINESTAQRPIHYQYYETQTSGQQFGYASGTFSNSAPDYTPFSYRSNVTIDGATAVTGSNGTTLFTRSGRYDLLGASISQMSQQVSAYLNWIPANDPNRTWWTTLMTGDQIGSGNPSNTSRFQAQTYVNKIDSDNLAYTAPLFVQHCSQFIVEYAGDYLTQQPQFLPSPPAAPNTPNPLAGQVTNVYTNSNGSDGQIDFVIDADGSKSIRWYGFPRDTNSNGTIPGTGVGTLAASSDTVPLRDLWVTSTAADPNNPYCAPFEKSLPTSSASPNYTRAWIVDYPMPYYECVWGPSDRKPWMIRITMTIDDPSGKLPDGQTFQYVIALPH